MESGLALRITTAAVLALLGVAAAFAATRRAKAATVDAAPLLQHVEELRRRLLAIVATLAAGIVAAMFVRIDLWNGVPVPSLAVYDSAASQLFGIARAHLVPASVELVVLGPMDGFMAQFYWAIGISCAVSLPVALYHLGRFVGPALRHAERQWLAWAVLPAAALFLLGGAFAYVWVLPVTFDALYDFSDALGARGLLQASDFSSFTISFVVGFGLGFQTPLVMVLLSRVGLVSPRVYWNYWRHAVVVILVVAMVLTPDPTIFSQVMLAVPLILLYLLGALIATRIAHREPTPASAG